MKALTMSDINGFFSGYISDYHAILNEKFKPELITELFEGWKQFDSHYIDYRNERYEVWPANGYMFFRRDYFETTTFPLPKTLGDFILFCQYAGIELEYKEKEKWK